MNTRTIAIEDTPELRFNPRIDGTYSGHVILGETRMGKTKLLSPEKQAEYKAAFELSEAEHASIKRQPNCVLCGSALENVNDIDGLCNTCITKTSS